MIHKFSFNSWNDMTQAMEIFFISTKTQTYAIEKIH